MKKIPLILVLGASAVLLMYGLYVVAANVNDRKNNFIRLVPPHSMGFVKRIDLDVNSYYYAGMHNNVVYLANRTDFDYFLKLDLRTKDTSHIVMSVPYFEGVNYDKLYSQVNDAGVFLTDAVNKNIIWGNIDRQQFQRQKVLFSFGPGQFPNDSVFIYQSYNAQQKIQYLNKWSGRGERAKLSSIPLGKDQEGFFPTDGMIYVYSDTSIIYVYRYKNKVLKTDGALRILGSFNTIDTNTFAKVSADYIKSQHKISMTAPPLIISNAGAIEGNLLYIKSPLIADNELKRDVEDNDPVDIYDLSTGKYIHSIYLPREKGKSARSFIVKNGMLISFYERSILLFKFNEVKKD